MNSSPIDRYATLVYHGEHVDVTIWEIYPGFQDEEYCSSSFHCSEEAELEQFIDENGAELIPF